LETAIERINSDPLCSVDVVSSVYETKPFGYKDQENFLNAAVRIYTDYSPAELFSLLKRIETDLGRTETIKWGPREIDLDILFYNDLIYNDENISIPHKGITERDFVLVPLCEINPELVHPGIGKKICEIELPNTYSNVTKKFTIDLLLK